MRNRLRELIFSDQTEEALNLAQSLSKTSTIESISALLLSLEDDYDYYDEMNAVMYAVERADAEIVYKVVISNLAQLNSQAPGWCETTIRRHLNAVDGKSPRFDAFKFIELSKNNPSAYSIIKTIGSSLLEEGLVPEAIREKLQNGDT